MDKSQEIANQLATRIANLEVEKADLIYQIKLLDHNYKNLLHEHNTTVNSLNEANQKISKFQDTLEEE
ncbi:MAG: hypothetical protein LKF42_08640 [Streptococcaceae bacterium]|jgi:chromosome segregation ATPase|nr:hypothetical protein [Streptococcaceae bacterium]MCH4177310.1 hypothetical protein [Streptococcaceae bacterium]